jgi:hypothetical protein
MLVQRLNARIVNASHIGDGTAAGLCGVPLSAPELESVHLASHRLDSDLA